VNYLGAGGAGVHEGGQRSRPDSGASGMEQLR